MRNGFSRHPSQDLKTQLGQERDAVRHLTLQKEIELKDIQTRMDKTVRSCVTYVSRCTDALIQSQELAKARESLVGAETSKKHLEERVDDLSRQLQGQHEKLAVYERRPGVTGVAQPTSVDMNHEQQLEAEVAELRLVTRLVVISLRLDSHIISCRSALKVAQMDLATARSHVQQFQDISQANETALASLNNTYDEYKSSTEAQMARHEVCLHPL